MQAMGYNTVALSRSADKEEFALKLGAHEFINTREPFDGVDKFDFVCVAPSHLLTTVPFNTHHGVP